MAFFDIVSKRKFRKLRAPIRNWPFFCFSLSNFDCRLNKKKQRKKQFRPNKWIFCPFKKLQCNFSSMFFCRINIEKKCRVHVEWFISLENALRWNKCRYFGIVMSAWTLLAYNHHAIDDCLQSLQFKIYIPFVSFWHFFPHNHYLPCKKTDTHNRNNTNHWIYFHLIDVNTIPMEHLISRNFIELCFWLFLEFFRQKNLLIFLRHSISIENLLRHFISTSRIFL